MRKWIAAHRKIVALVVLAVAYAAGVVLFVSLGHELGETLFSAALWFFFTVAAWCLDARRQRKTAAKLEDQGGLLVYVRYPDSRPGSLSGIWKRATPGALVGMLLISPAMYTEPMPGPG